MIRRLQKEVVQLQDKSLRDTGIYYFMKDDFTKATAILFGPKDTPYEYCPLEFVFSLPNDYPFSPPSVLYNTNDGKTRFHPNFYADGKVCLSILGTYSGPKWASTMSISTVLLSIYSILTSNPLVHEPSYEGTHASTPKNQQYSDYIEHQMVRLFLNNMNTNYYTQFEDEEFQDTLLRNYTIIQNKVEQRAKDQEILYTILPYSMTGSTCWKKMTKFAKN